MNSGSQSKIRKIQEINLISERRYLKNKSLLNEAMQEDIITCLQTAAGITEAEIMALAPCSELQQNPSDSTKVQACVTSVIGVATKKLDINIFDPIGSGKKVLDMTQKIMACASQLQNPAP